MIFPMIVLEATTPVTTNATDMINLVLTLLPVVIMGAVVFSVVHAVSSFGGSTGYGGSGDWVPEKRFLETNLHFKERQRQKEAWGRIINRNQQTTTEDDEEEPEPEPEPVAPTPEPIYHSKYGARVDKAAEMLKQQYEDQMDNENKPWYKKKKVMKDN